MLVKQGMLTDVISGAVMHSPMSEHKTVPSSNQKLTIVSWAYNFPSGNKISEKIISSRMSCLQVGLNSSNYNINVFMKKENPAKLKMRVAGFVVMTHRARGEQKDQSTSLR
jgi:hypothetical protein